MSAFVFPVLSCFPLLFWLSLFIVFHLCLVSSCVCSPWGPLFLCLSSRPFCSSPVCHLVISSCVFRSLSFPQSLSVCLLCSPVLSVLLVFTRFDIHFVSLCLWFCYLLLLLEFLPALVFSPFCSLDLCFAYRFISLLKLTLLSITCLPPCVSASGSLQTIP